MAKFMTWICDKCSKSKEHDAMFCLHLAGYTQPNNDKLKYIPEAHLCNECYVIFRGWLGK